MRTSRVLRAAVACGAVVTGVSVLSGAPPAAAATGLPTGFADLFVANVASATSLTPLADGRVLVTTQPGGVSTINAATLATAAVSVPGLAVCSNSERGLLGAAQDPTNPSAVYLYYTVGGSCVNRVARYTLSGNTLSSPTIILDNVPSQAGNHNGGDLHFGKDGFLYVSVGDSGCDPRGDSGCSAPTTTAQDLSLLSGRSCASRSNGDPAPGNPFAGTANGVACKTGRRHRRRCAGRSTPTGCGTPSASRPTRTPPAPGSSSTTWARTSGRRSTTSAGGADYAWPCKEGPAPKSATGCPVPAAVKDPFHAYNHPTGCQSVTGGAFVPNGAWPGYDGAYVYADFVCGRIFTLSASCGGQWASSVLADNAGPVVDLQFVGDQLWYTSYNGQVRRIVPPTAPGGGIGEPARVDPAGPEARHTRLGIGGPAGVVPAGGTRTVSLGPQVPPGAVAAVVNVTITQATAPGFVTAWPADKPQPFTSTLNVTTPGQTVPNTALVAVSTGGQLNLFTLGGGHLIVDVYGYFASSGPTTAGRFVSLAPSRLFDTRNGTNAPRDRVNGQLDVTVAGRNGVPPAGVSAVALVVTGTEPVGSSFVTTWSTGTAFPPTSTINLNGPTDTRANLVVVPVGAAAR